jgi:hypothetical protein
MAEAMPAPRRNFWLGERASACRRSPPSSPCLSQLGLRLGLASWPCRASSNGSPRSVICLTGSLPARSCRSNPAGSVRGPRHEPTRPEFSERAVHWQLAFRHRSALRWVEARTLVPDRVFPRHAPNRAASLPSSTHWGQCLGAERSAAFCPHPRQDAAARPAIDQ